MNGTEEQLRLPSSVQTNSKPGFIVGTAFLSILVCLVVFIPEPTGPQLLIFRSILALSGAGYSLSLTGFLSVRCKLWHRVTAMAGGSLAVFMLLYFATPDLRLGRKNDGPGQLDARLGSTSLPEKRPLAGSVSITQSGTGNFASVDNSGIQSVPKQPSK